MAFKLIFFILFALYTVERISAQGTLNPSRVEEQALLDSIFGRNYDPRINPGGNSNGSAPTTVTVNMYVRSIDSVDSEKMQMKVQLTMRFQWMDSRLTYKLPKSNPNLHFLSLVNPSKVWTPDLFMSNEKEAKLHDFSQLNQYLRIFPNGEILQSQRVSATLGCPMNFKNFPLDRQVCTLRMASYGSTTRDIIMKWKQTDPIQVSSELHITQFTLEQFTTDHCDSQTITGVYSCLRVDFRFLRYTSPYLVHVFIPTTMLIIIAWLCFWLDTKSALVGRLAVALFALGLMVIVVMWEGNKFPVVMYTKAIDCWTGICLTFAFFALVETIVAYYLARSNCGVNCKESCPCPAPAVVDAEGGEGKSLKLWVQEYWHGLGGCSQKLDWLVRILYPILFILFVIIFYVQLQVKFRDS